MTKFASIAARSSRVVAVPAVPAGSFDPARDGTRAPPPTRVGTVVFWGAVLCLIAARVVCFDPAAHRPVGSLPQASLAPSLTR